MTLETIVGGGIAILLSVVGYFLKKTHDKIDTTSTNIGQIGKDVDNRISRLETKLEVETKATKAEITQVFQDICHERQSACGLLRDAKLQAVSNQASVQCKKIESMISDRERRWEKQEQLNEKFRNHIYQTKDSGSSWDLKDK